MKGSASLCRRCKRKCSGYRSVLGWCELGVIAVLIVARCHALSRVNYRLPRWVDTAARQSILPPRLECGEPSLPGCDWIYLSTVINAPSGSEILYPRKASSEAHDGGWIPGGWRASHTGANDHQFPWLATVITLICLLTVIVAIAYGEDLGLY